MGERFNIPPIAPDHFAQFIAVAVSLLAAVFLLRATHSAVAVIITSLLASLLAVLLSSLLRRQRLRILVKRELDRMLPEFAYIQRKLERERIARELHDGLCSTLLAAKAWLEQAIQHSDAADDWAKPCSRSLAELENALRETRRISHGLAPAILGSHGFTDTLRHMSCEFSERTRIKTQLLGATPKLDQQLPAACQAALVRITQEALANIEKHSAASCVTLGLQASEESLTLTIADDGHSFCQLAGRNSGVKVGLSNMRERLAEIGGTLTLRFAPDSTEVMAQLPLTLIGPGAKHNTERLFTGALP